MHANTLPSSLLCLPDHSIYFRFPHAMLITRIIYTHNLMMHIFVYLHAVKVGEQGQGQSTVAFVVRVIDIYRVCPRVKETSEVGCARYLSSRLSDWDTARHMRARTHTHTPTHTIRASGDRKTHLYTLVIRPDNSFEILIDNESKKIGSLVHTTISLYYPLSPMHQTPCNTCISMPYTPDTTLCMCSLELARTF